MDSLEQARRIAGIAQDKLADDVVILDMRPVCVYTDFFVVCSGFWLELTGCFCLAMGLVLSAR